MLMLRLQRSPPRQQPFWNSSLMACDEWHMKGRSFGMDRVFGMHLQEGGRGGGLEEEDLKSVIQY